jgi:hypothetical protein
LRRACTVSEIEVTVIFMGSTVTEEVPSIRTEACLTTGCLLTVCAICAR